MFLSSGKNKNNGRKIENVFNFKKPATSFYSWQNTTFPLSLFSTFSTPAVTPSTCCHSVNKPIGSLFHVPCLTRKPPRRRGTRVSICSRFVVLSALSSSAHSVRLLNFFLDFVLVPISPLNHVPKSHLLYDLLNRFDFPDHCFVIPYNSRLGLSWCGLFFPRLCKWWVLRVQTILRHSRRRSTASQSQSLLRGPPMLIFTAIWHWKR